MAVLCEVAKDWKQLSYPSLGEYYSLSFYTVEFHAA